MKDFMVITGTPRMDMLSWRGLNPPPVAICPHTDARLHSQRCRPPLQLTLDDVGNEISVPHPLHCAVRTEASPSRSCSPTSMIASPCVYALSMHDWHVAAWTEISVMCFLSSPKLIILQLLNDIGLVVLVNVSCSVSHLVGGFFFLNLPSEMCRSCSFLVTHWTPKCKSMINQ